jgi:hypothetical protein
VEFVDLLAAAQQTSVRTRRRPNPLALVIETLAEYLP